jgi:hypothetical protein
VPCRVIHCFRRQHLYLAPRPAMQVLTGEVGWGGLGLHSSATDSDGKLQAAAADGNGRTCQSLRVLAPRELEQSEVCLLEVQWGCSRPKGCAPPPPPPAAVSGGGASVVAQAQAQQQDDDQQLQEAVAGGRPLPNMEMVATGVAEGGSTAAGTTRTTLLLKRYHLRRLMARIPKPEAKWRVTATSFINEAAFLSQVKRRCALGVFA